MSLTDWIKNLPQKKSRLLASSNVDEVHPSPEQAKLSVCTFYHYQEIQASDLDRIKKELLESSEAENIRGLVLLSSEGINATLTGLHSHLEKFVSLIQEKTKIDVQARWQFTPIFGFKKLRIKIKNEIVNTGNSDLELPPPQTHLSPEEWKKILESGSPFFILDVRNDYEVNIGKFKGAAHLSLKKFKDFSQKLQNHEIPKEAHVLIYCTGGIRCEKALTEMKNQGFTKVSLLKGGILNFLAQFPNTHFEGDCFVFDHRVSLNQKLVPSGQYDLCPHCGQPGNKEIQCQHCQKPCRVCQECFDQTENYQTCSKNCSYHFKNGHKCKKNHLSSR